MRKLYFLVLLSLFLVGCASVSPNKLGISQSDWNQYSPSQREQIMENYRQTQRAKITKAKSGNSELTVNIENGKVLMPPFTELTAFDPLSFDIKEGSCNIKIAMQSSDNPKQRGSLGVCYQAGTLFMDPSPIDPTKANGSLQFQYLPMWKRGFTYPSVSSTGIAKLTNVNISVKEISQ